MTAPAPRAERRAGRLRERRSDRRSRRTQGAGVRIHAGRLAFGGVALAVLGIGSYLAFGDFLGRPESPGGGVISVRASMAGFTPVAIRVRAGELVELDFWTQDGSNHLQGGIHTMIGEELGLYATLPGADLVSTSRVAVRFVAPDVPGEYDIYCDTCCGGRSSPSMHGTVIVEA